MLGVAVWHLVRRPDTDRAEFRSAAKLGAITVLVASVGVAVTGDLQGKVMTEVQPMKMAAAEALYNTEKPASFSLFTVGTLNGSKEVASIKVPHLLSFLATGTFDGQVQGINDLQAQYEQRYGPGNYKPNIPVTYWMFRLMIGAGVLAGLAAVWLLWLFRRGRRPTSRWVVWSGVALPLLPLLANSFGWIFTEMGRQPWIVFGLMPTAAGVSPRTSTAEVVTSLSVFTVLYAGLAVVEVGLLAKYVKAGLPEIPPSSPVDQPEADRPMSFAY
jgi:cytochrome d ubiquinol oxidase subunit I